MSNLHHESLEADLLVAVGLVAVELEVVVEDEAVLHVRRHLDPNSCCTWVKMNHVEPVCSILPKLGVNKLWLVPGLILG